MRHFFIMVMAVLIVAACSVISKKAPLSYKDDPESLIVNGDVISWPGGPLPGQECNRIPNVRIWGDGRVVYTDVINGGRGVFTGRISQENLQLILEQLDQNGFFTNPPPNTVNPAGTGYTLNVNLKNKTYQSFWSNEPKLYSDLISTIKKESLELYTPDQGLLIVGPYNESPWVYPVPTWPKSFPFSLAEVGLEGKWISGDIVRYVWEVINNHRGPLAGIEENGNLYSVGLEIKGISIKDPPYDCWNR